MKEGDVGAEVFLSLFARPGNTPAGFDRRLLNEVDVLIPKFFRFLAFFAGVVGLCSSKNVVGEDSLDPLPALRDLKSAENEGAAAFEMGDSGEGPGEGSVTEEESMVEIVVVGELSDDSEATVDVLSRCTWKLEKALDEVEAMGKFPLEAGRPMLLP